ncbi:MAG: hypothetical protein ABSB14_02735 [Candidatus Sulfotelmatobacter sp.]
MSDFSPSYGEIYRQYQRPESDFFGGMALLAMLACVVNCVLPQVEMLLTGGGVPVPQAFIKAACFGALIILMLVYGKLDLSSFPTSTWLFAMAYLVLVFPYLWFSQRKEPGEILLAYNAYYCPLIFAPAACALKGKLSDSLAVRVFLCIFGACALLGWAQFIFQDPIVRLASSDGSFRIYSSLWMQEGETTVRSTSFFGSALEYGSFCVLVAAIGIGICRKRGGWKIGVPLYLFAAASCYTTLTRVVFLQLAIATVAALTFTFGRSLRRMTWQPFTALGVGYLIAFSGIAKLIGQTKSLIDNSSLELRLLQWEMYGAELWRGTLAQQLFGLGFCQADKPVIVPRRDDFLGKASTVLVDNLYLALTLHIGLVGMVSVLALLWAMWRYLRKETIERPTPLLIGIASFWATFLMTGMFNVQPALYGFWFLIGILVFRRAGDFDQAGDVLQSEEDEPVSEFGELEAVAP